MPPKRMPVVYGIDVGFQFTKFAVSYPKKTASGDQASYSAASICKLPGLETALVPTIVEYKDSRPSIPVNSGSSALDNGANGKVDRPSSNAASEDNPRLKLEGPQHWFKLDALSEAVKRDAMRKKAPKARLPPPDPVLKVLEHFLGELLKEIRHFHDHWAAGHSGPPAWHEVDIDFIFSVPSIVDEPGARALEEIARQAGFASSDRRHIVAPIQLTEAEAAGVHAMTSMKQLMSVGDTALVIDFGGGTTDLSMLTLAGNEQWKLDNNFLEPVSSGRLGGAHIDEVIGNKMVRCLEAVAKTGTDLKEITAQVRMLQAKKLYHERKVACQLWDPLVDFPSADCTLTQRLPEESTGDDVCLTVKSGKLECRVPASLFARLLDTKIHGTSSTQGIISHVLTMRDDLAVRCPSQSRQHDKINNIPKNCKKDPAQPDTLDFVFFAGGLGPAPRLIEAVKGALAPKPNETRLQHTTANTRCEPLEDAQHAVALGLVWYWTGKIESVNHKDRFVFKPWLKRVGRK